MTSNTIYYPNILAGASVAGILAGDPRANPFWYTWNHVSIGYCSSDSYLGEAGTGSFSFQPAWFEVRFASAKYMYPSRRRPCVLSTQAFPLLKLLTFSTGVCHPAVQQQLCQGPLAHDRPIKCRFAMLYPSMVFWIFCGVSKVLWL